MKRKFVVVTALLCAALLLTGCGKTVEEPAKEEPPVVEEPVEEPAGKTSVFITENTESVADGDVTLLDIIMEKAEVKMTSAETAAKINAALQESYDVFYADKDGYVETAKEDYKVRSETEGFEPEYWDSFDMERRISVYRGDEAVLSFVYTGYCYTGGVHGSGWEYCENYDALTGEVLKIADIETEPAKLETYAAKRLPEIAGESDEKAGYFEGWETVAAGLLRDGNWAFSAEGITVFSGQYEMGPYAQGILEFTIPYSELEGLVKEQYLPAARAGAMPSGEALTVGFEKDFDIANLAVDSVAVNDGGEKAVIVPAADIYDVKVVSGEYYGDDIFYETTMFYFASHMTAADAVAVTSYIPDAMPNVRITYTLADGTVESRFISQSGDDGSLLLLKIDYTEPVEISGQLPYSVDLDGDGVKEEISLLQNTDTEVYEDSLISLKVTKDGKEYTAPTDAAYNASVWLADVDGDNLPEIFLSGDVASDDYVTYCWRFDGEITAVPFAGEVRYDESADTVSVDGSVKYFNGRNVVINSAIYMMGTYGGDMTYTFEGGQIVPAAGEKWVFTGNETELVLKKDLPVTLDDSTETTLASGRKITLTQTDGVSRAWFVTSDSGELVIGSIAVARDTENWGWLINGVSENDYFEVLPYAG